MENRKEYEVIDDPWKEEERNVEELVNEMISDGWLKIEDETMLDDNRKW
jgi:hypothetical protein